jgi:hypothetical protein
MSEHANLSFLKALDTKVWVKKRIFPVRLIVLDELEERIDGQAFITDVLNEILYLDTEWNAHTDQSLVTIVEQKGLPDAIIAVLQRFRNTPCDSVLTQFLSDLETFGLREALAYLFEGDRDISDRLREMMVAEYEKIGIRFNTRSEDVRSALQEKFDDLMRHNDISECLARLIGLSGIHDGDVWYDGYEQFNMAHRSLGEL